MYIYIYVLGGRGLVGLRSPPSITYSFRGRLRIPLGTDSFCHQAGKRYDTEKYAVESPYNLKPVA